MTRRSFWTIAAAVVVAALAGTVALTGGAPGACCVDVDPSRPDCPGLIRCPLTGELVCRDRCPADRKQSLEPSCCR